jgi:glutamyl-tRNA reductase
MALFTLGINHHTAPLSVREQMAFHAESLPGHWLTWRTAKPVHEAAILSTCNRTELYVATDVP